jgi:hypothetical protein
VRAGQVITAGTGGGDAGAVEGPWVRWRRVAAVLAPFAACLVLLGQFLGTAQINTVPDNLTLSYLLADWGELGLSAVFALLTALAAARAIGSALPDEGGGVPDDPGRGLGQQIGAGVVAAAAAGMTGAALAAIFCGIVLSVPDGAFLRWALVTPAPIAALATLTGVALVRDPVAPPRGWAAWLSLPHASIGLAAVGMFATQFALTAPGYPVLATAQTMLTFAGGALLGAGVAFALPLPPRYQIIAAFPVGLACAAIDASTTTGLLAGLYAIAVTLWWGRRLWQVTRLQAAEHGTGPWSARRGTWGTKGRSPTGWTE